MMLSFPVSYNCHALSVPQMYLLMGKMPVHRSILQKESNKIKMGYSFSISKNCFSKSSGLVKKQTFHFFYASLITKDTNYFYDSFELVKSNILMTENICR